MKKKDREKKIALEGLGTVETIFLFGRYFDRVTERQAEYLKKNKRKCSRETAILKLIIGE